MLHDDMIHGTFTDSRSEGSIERETPLLPRVVAEAVLAEASEWLDSPLPPSWIDELAARAEEVYDANARFRRTLRSRGDEGRDWLWAFTRHWLAALLQQQAPHLHLRLPASYSTGHNLPHRHR